MDIKSYFRSGCFDLDEIRWPDADKCPDYGQMVEIETESRFPIWRTSVFSKTEAIISQPSIDMSTKFGLLIDFDLLNAVTSTNTKP